MENKSIILFFVGFIVVFFFGMAVFNNIFDTALLMDTTTITTSDTILANNGTATTLSETPEVVSSTVVKNQTWLEFDGVDDSLSSNSDLTNYNSSSEFTIVGFFNRIGNSSDPNVPYLSKGNYYNNDSTFGIRYTPGNDRLQYSIGTCFYYDTGLMVDNVWQQVGLVYKKDVNGDPYLNGIDLANTDCKNVFANQTTDSITIGIDRVGDVFNGSIDEIKYYNRSLSPIQMSRLYNESKYGTGLGQSIPVLSFHRIDNPASDSTFVNLTEFESYLSWLNSTGFNSITYNNYYNWVQGTELLPERPIIIVFDDGRKDMFTNGSTLMTQYGFVGVVNIITNTAVGNSLYMNWSDIQNLSDQGWQIGSHSVSHCNFLTECNTTQNWTDEFSNSKQDILGNISITPTLFVYPYNSNNDTSDNLCDDYYTICSGNTQSITVKGSYVFKESNYTHETNVLGLKRVEVVNTTTLLHIQNYVDYYTDLVFEYKLNENQGTTAYDVSGNANNGTISGATWNDDGVLISLIDSVDFSISKDTFIIINNLYSWDQILFNYNYIIVSSSFTTTILRFVGGFIALAFIGFLLIIIMRQLNEVKEIK